MVCLRHSDGVIIASKSKVAIGNHVDISDDTVRRHSSINKVYKTMNFTIWYDVEVMKAH